MKSLLELIKANPLVTIFTIVVLAVLLHYFSGSIKQAWQDHRTDRAVEKLEGQSNDLQQKAHQEITEADKKSGARAAEDERRQTEIKPQIENAARNRETARAATQKAQRDYENSRKRGRGTAGADLRALHQRNCRQFTELYPDEPGCR